MLGAASARGFWLRARGRSAPDKGPWWQPPGGVGPGSSRNGRPRLLRSRISTRTPCPGSAGAVNNPSQKFCGGWHYCVGKAPAFPGPFGHEIQDRPVDVGADFFGRLGGINHPAIAKTLDQFQVGRALAFGFRERHFLLSALQYFSRRVEQDDQIGLLQKEVAEADDGLRHAQPVAPLVHKEVVVITVNQHQPAPESNRPQTQVRAEEELQPVKPEVAERNDGIARRQAVGIGRRAARCLAPGGKQRRFPMELAHLLRGERDARARPLRRGRRWICHCRQRRTARRSRPVVAGNAWPAVGHQPAGI